MHIYLRGDPLQKLRLASGLVLFAFAGTHFLNHALGLHSLEAMHYAQEWRTAVTRSFVGSIVLGAALACHILLGLHKLAKRKTLRMPLWEAAQILLALAIPFLLFPHIVNTRIASSVFGVRDTYLYELARLWPDRRVLQSLLLLIVWAHGCVGLHYWLRLTDAYWRYVGFLLVIAIAVPVLAVAGFAVSGSRTAEIMSDPDMLAKLKQSSRWPNASDGATMAMLRDLSQVLFAAFLAAIGAVWIWRRRPRVFTILPARISYVDGPTIAAPKGMTLLEVSRANGVPHASLCGGRARCATCRVRVDHGLAELGPPGRAEAIALKSIEAAPNVRLACQIRPTAALTVTVLLRPDTPGPSVLDFLEIKAVAAAHVRAVLGNGMVDKKSVRADELAAWFAGKVPYGVVVNDLGQRGFPLVGGRLDYLLDKPVAALVYDRDGHPISLFVLPAGNGDSFAVRGAKHGYNVVGWSNDTFAYFAASDVGRPELDKLEACFATPDALGIPQ